MRKVEIQNPQGLLENIEAFVSAVDIYEPIIVSIIALHIVVFILVLILRKNSRTLLVLFVILLGICYSLEALNRYLGENWKDLTKQNYFDRSGLFVCVLIGFPCLINCFIIVGISLCGTVGQLKKFARLKRDKQE